jgi:hypothetical protein
MPEPLPVRTILGAGAFAALLLVSAMALWPREPTFAQQADVLAGRAENDRDALDEMTTARTAPVTADARDQTTVDYVGLRESSRDLDTFGERLLDVWTDAYLAETRTACRADLVVVDPGNGFNYLFDLAGSLGPVTRVQAPRVVGVHGRSRVASWRDWSRMRRFPRPSRASDDRGHLISSAAGGGYDINLVPMDAALNRGWSADGARFRAIERRAAAKPGCLFFIRPLYANETDRPTSFEVGVDDGTLVVDSFVNRSGTPLGSCARSLRTATAFDLLADLVTGCLDPNSERDVLFEKGWRSGPGSLTPAQRCVIAGTTGHVAESVVELLLDEIGWYPLHNFVGPGGHGADLVFLTPGDEVLVVEVKGTLRRGRIPRLSRREIEQMSAPWLDKGDNPGMEGLNLGSEDVYGAVVTVNFADLAWRAALTDDFTAWRPVVALDALDDVAGAGRADERRDRQMR